MKLGVMLPIFDDQETGGPARSYQEIRALAQQVEAVGLDSIWLADHLIFRHPEQPEVGAWECWTLLTALAEATERVELGPLVLCGPFRNAGLTAKMATMLDEVSNGRLILGLGAGWHQPEFDAFGYAFDHRVDRFEQLLQVVKPLVTSGKADFHGNYSSAIAAVDRPRGPRPGGPPILIGASGPRMLRLTARYADAWNTCWLGDPAQLAPKLADLHAACAAEGRDPKTLEITVGVSVAFPPATETPEFKEKPGQALSGTPEQIAAGLRGFTDQGASHIIALLDPCTPETIAALAEAGKLV